jgi:hypothetical protein
MKEGVFMIYENQYNQIEDLKKQIKKHKRIRDAYSLIGSSKVKENDQIILDLENQLILFKLKKAK